MALMQSRDEKDAADEKSDGYKASADKDGDRRKGRCAGLCIYANLRILKVAS